MASLPVVPNSNDSRKMRTVVGHVDTYRCGVKRVDTANVGGRVRESGAGPGRLEASESFGRGS